MGPHTRTRTLAEVFDSASEAVRQLSEAIDRAAGSGVDLTERLEAALARRCPEGPEHAFGFTTREIGNHGVLVTLVCSRCGESRVRTLRRGETER